jgi:hypothetical protein
MITKILFRSSGQTDSTSDQDSIELVSDKDFTDENGEISFVVNGATTGLCDLFRL